MAYSINRPGDLADLMRAPGAAGCAPGPRPEAPPVEWLGGFQVNTGTAAAGGQSDPQTIGLANGNILVAWEEAANGSVGGATGGIDIVGKIYDAEGDLVRDSFQINFFRAGDNEADFDIAATSDGGFVLVYIDHDISNPSQDSVCWERRDALGNYVTGAIVDDEFAAADSFANPKVAVDLRTNFSFITWTADIDEDLDVRGNTVTFAGALGSELNAGQNTGAIDDSNDVAVLSNGNFVSVFREFDALIGNIEFRIMSAAGALTGAVNLSAAEAAEPKAAALAGGGFVVVWRSAEDNGNIRYHVFDNAGDAVGGESFAAAGTDLQDEAEVVALVDGDFVILWDNDTDATIEGQRFNANGSPDSGPFVIENSDTTMPNVGLTADGRLLLTWVANDGDGEIFSKIRDPRGSVIDANDYADNSGSPHLLDATIVTGGPGATALNGNDIFGLELLGQGGDDTIVGGHSSQTIRGGGGNDLIAGGEAFVNPTSIVGDSIDGGEGNDAIVGAAGNDTIVGDVGRDRIEGGDGDDSIDGGLSEDTLLGGLGNDTLLAHAALTSVNGDSLDGAGGDDSLTGAVGGDTLNGGAGGDTLTGGAGSDWADHTGGPRIRADLQFSRLNSGEALGDSYISIENLRGGAFADTLRGDGTANRLEGAGGNDALTGRDGNDSLFGGAAADTLSGGAGGDSLDGGDGADWADYSGAPRRVTADLQIPTNNTQEALGDSYVSIENLRGGALADNLRGDANPNRIEGGVRNDVIVGRAGNDTLVGGPGFDQLAGQQGVDLILLASPDAVDYDRIVGFASNETILLDGATFGLAPGALDPDAFVLGAGAQDAEDRIVYLESVGKLFFDPDGVGGISRSLIAIIENRPIMDASDFLVI